MKTTNKVLLGLSLLASLYSTNAFAAEKKISFVGRCAGKSVCAYDKGGIKIEAKCDHYSAEFTSYSNNIYTSLRCSRGDMEITSSHYITKLASLSGYSSPEYSKDEAVIYAHKTKDDIKLYKLENRVKKIVIKATGLTDAYMNDIYIEDQVTVNSMTDTFSNPVRFYDYFIDLTLESVQGFKKEIAASDAGHFTRYVESLKDCSAILNDENFYSIVDWRVQECSRRVLVFGTVLNELLNDYAHVERLNTYISNIQNLTDGIRKVYGWDRGLAGNTSKATGALLDVMKLEVREILSVKISAGSTNFQTYSSMLNELSTLISKINASRSGDMALQRHIWDLVDLWNGDVWQKELKALMESPVDEKKLVLPKLQLLLMSVESLNDLTKAGLEIPFEN